MQAAGQLTSVYVPSGFGCASACASIIFLSGRFHIVLDGGFIAFHTCSININAKPHPSSFCNERIFDNAWNHGTSFGLLSYLMQPDTLKKLGRESEGIVWMGSDVACQYGMCGPPSFEEHLAIPSFECEKAVLQSEKLICSNRLLARYDNQISEVYFEIRKALSRNQHAKDKLKLLQLEFLKKRNECGDDVRCMHARMKKRYHELLNDLSKIQSGKYPF